MELAIRMKTIMRFLIFLATILTWLVILVILNAFVLNLEDLTIVVGAFLLSVVTTFGIAKALRT